MNSKATMCILFQDETVETVFIDRTLLGAQIRFMQRLPRDEHVFEEIGRLMRSPEKMPARVLLCPPRELTLQRTLRYPVVADADLEGMVRFEASRHVPLPEAERSLGWAAVPSVDQKQTILNLVAARSSDIQTLVAAFEEAGVPIDEAVPFSSALFPILGSRPTLLVVSDVRHVELCLYGEGQLQDSQSINAEAPGFAAEQVISAARRMTAGHRSWLGMEGVARIRTCGPAPLDGSFGADLGAAFGLSVLPLEPPEETGDLESPLADVLLAGTARLPAGISLLEQSGRKVPMSKRTMLIGGLCILLVAELAAWAGLKTAAPAMQRKEIARELAAARRRAAPVQRMADRNREMHRQLYRLDEICRSHISSMQVLKSLSDLLPEDTYLYLINYRNGSISLKGLSKEPDRIPDLLMSSPLVEAISKSDIGKKEGDYHAIAINLTLRTPDEETER